MCHCQYILFGSNEKKNLPFSKAIQENPEKLRRLTSKPQLKRGPFFKRHHFKTHLTGVFGLDKAPVIQRSFEIPPAVFGYFRQSDSRRTVEWKLQPMMAQDATMEVLLCGRLSGTGVKQSHPFITYAHGRESVLWDVGSRPPEQGDWSLVGQWHFVASVYTCHFDFHAKKETKTELLKHDLLGNWVCQKFVNWVCQNNFLNYAAKKFHHQWQLKTP